MMVISCNWYSVAIGQPTTEFKTCVVVMTLLTLKGV